MVYKQDYACFIEEKGVYQMKKLLALLLALAMVFSMAACGAAPAAAEEEKIRIKKY